MLKRRLISAVCLSAVFAITALIAAALLPGDGTARAASNWTTRPPSDCPCDPDGRSGLPAVVAGGEIYWVGGENAPLHDTGLWKYSPSTDDWTPLPTPIVARAWPGAGVIGDKIYLVGGSAAIGFFSSLEVYDIPTNTWSPNDPATGDPLPPMPGGG